MSFWEWAGTSDSTAVLTSILGTGGLGGVVLLIVRHLFKDKPSKHEQIQAVEAVAAPAPDRDALWIAREALTASASDREALQAVQTQLKDMAGKVEVLEKQRAEDTHTIGKLRQALESFLAWVRHLQTHWDEIRARPYPPAPPKIDID